VMFVFVSTVASEGALAQDASAALRAPRPGHARVVIYRDKGFGGLFNLGWAAQLDGKPIGDIKPGTFAYRDVPPGRRQLSFMASDFPRPSVHSFSAAAGRVYFFRIQQNDKGRMIYGGQVAAGLAGLLITNAIAAQQDQRGTFDFVAVDAATARKTLADFSFAPPP
jgi:hypothetical protein